MSKVLILAEHNGTQVNQSTSKVLTAAKQLNVDTIDVVVFGNDTSLAPQVAALNGVSQVHYVQCDDKHDQLAASIAPTVADMGKNYSHVFGPSTTFGKDVMPRVAALLEVNQVSDVMEIIDANTFKRPIYAGNAIITVNTDTAQIVATVRTASFPADKSTDGQ
ncbi:Electron transfer flavoprotein, alpha subunit, partial [hydrothermal vent metagenome]